MYFFRDERQQDMFLNADYRVGTFAEIYLFNGFAYTRFVVIKKNF